MRIALAPSGSVGFRAGRVLLADKRVNAVGAFGADVHSQDSRVESIESLEGWDIIVSDAPPNDERVSAAARLRVPVVSPLTYEDLAGVARRTPTVAAASPGSGLPASLAIAALDRFDAVTGVSAAVTAPAKRLPHRFPMSFPAPIGALWSEKARAPVRTPKDLAFFLAPYDGPLFGITVLAEGTAGGVSATAVQGVVDDPEYLGAIALAGAALMLIGAALPEGPIEVSERAQLYVDACVEAGMGVASFNPAS